MSSPDPMVRMMRREDVDAVLLLARDEPSAPRWPPFEYLRMLKVIADQPGRRGAWIVQSEGALAGFAMAGHVAGVCDLEAVVVAPFVRRRGLGTLLVQAVIGWAQALRAERLQLEARPSNEAALRLYLRLGFVLDGRRPAYYQNPPEDAVLMGLSLPQSPKNL